MDVDLTAIPRAFHLPRPNWQNIRAWVGRHVPEPDRPAAWGDLAAQWLAVLNQALGNAYRVERGHRLLCFAPAGSGMAEHIAQFGEAVLAGLGDLLGDVASDSWPGPLAVLLFADREAYYTYVAQFYPEQGEFGGSAGMCIRSDGYLHIVLHPGPPEAVRRAAVHEITHACLSHRSLPLWLEEGITQWAEEALAGKHSLLLEPEQAGQIRHYWREHGLQDFWWGQGFFLPDEGRGYGYGLAEILFKLLSADHRPRVPEFVRQAHRDDAGEGTARAVLGTSLAALAGQFLGPGPWEPVPPAAAYRRRGALHLDRGEYDRAVADFTQALGQEPTSAEAHAQRGLAHYQLGRYAAAVADYERAIGLDPEALLAHNNLAWLLATCPDGGIRDGRRAVEHATRACELCGFAEWYCLGTLAAAHAEAGDFEEARDFAKQSLRRAPEAERPGCQERLRLYKEQRPYREAPRPVAPA
jgi:tetratricopeptide (TPR) repeat protein